MSKRRLVVGDRVLAPVRIKEWPYVRFDPGWIGRVAENAITVEFNPPGSEHRASLVYRNDDDLRWIPQEDAE